MRCMYANGQGVDEGDGKAEERKDIVIDFCLVISAGALRGSRVLDVNWVPLTPSSN